MNPCATRTRVVTAAFACLAAWLAAQSADAASLAGDNPEAVPGETGLPYHFHLEVVTGERVAAVQFELVLDPEVLALSSGTMAPGPVATEAGKTVSLNNLAPGRYRVIVAGLNQTEIASGRLLDAALDVQASAPGGNHTVGIERLVISNPNGSPVIADPLPGAVFVVRDAPPPEQCGCGPGAGGSRSLPYGDAAVLLAAACAAMLGIRRTSRYARQ